MEVLKMSSGIYKITNKITSKIYIGSSIDVRRRIMKHKSLLRRGKHHSKYLQNSWDKYGEEAFVFEKILEVKDKTRLLEFEQEFINDLEPEFNMCPTAGNRLGFKFSEETKSLLAEKSRGNKNFKGRKHSEGTREKMRKAHLGKKMSAEAREKMRVANLGRKRPESDKKKISETMKKQKWRRAIDDEKILEIREKLANGQSQRSLAKEYGVDRGVIKRIKNRTNGYE